MRGSSILAINGGSSSIKLALYALAEPRHRTLRGQIERIGLNGTVLRIARADGKEEAVPIAASDHASAIIALLDWLATHLDLDDLAAVGHRIVHGGSDHRTPARVDDTLLASLQALCAIDPAHLPAELAIVEALRRRRPGLPQVLCFDTAFHAAMPRVAQMLPLPRRYEAKGLRRYGFHGLSYEFLLRELGRLAGDAAARGRVVLAHLGSGSSLAAVHDGRCLDTSMSFTPTAGVPMATRTGDLDPGVLLHLLRHEGLTVEAVDALVNRESGLLGVSETSSDMRDLLARRDGDVRAAEAVALYCYQVRKYVGAYAAVLGGLDTLVFSGGIGERAAAVRSEICTELGFLGVTIDDERNRANAPIISQDGAQAMVRVIATDEELIVAESTRRVLGLGA